MTGRAIPATHVVEIDGIPQSHCDSCYEAQAKRPQVQNAGLAEKKGRPTLKRANVQAVQGDRQADPGNGS